MPDFAIPLIIVGGAAILAFLMFLTFPSGQDCDDDCDEHPWD